MRLDATQGVWYLVTKGGQDATYANYLIGVNASQIYGYYYTAAGVAKFATASATTMQPGLWYSIALTNDNTTKDLKLYYTGRATHRDEAQASAYTLIASSNNPGSVPNASTEPLRVGYGLNASSAAVGATATISEVRIYASALSSSTLNSRLGQRLTGNESTLRAYHRLDDGLGGYGGVTSFDRTQGAGRNGTMLNGATWADDPPDLYYPVGLNPTGWLAWHSATSLPAAVVTASSENASYPATNLRTPRQSTTTRTADVTGAKTWVTYFGGPRPIYGLTVRNHNLTSAATITVALHSSDSWGSPSVSETVTVHPAQLNHVFTRPGMYAYARLSVTDAANADGYLELGTLDWWDGVVPLLGEVATEGQAVLLTDPSTLARTAHDHVVARELPVSSGLSVDLHNLRLGWSAALRAALRFAGQGAPVWLAPDPRRGLYPRSVYGTLTALGQETIAGRDWNHSDMSGIQIVADRA